MESQLKTQAQTAFKTVMEKNPNEAKQIQEYLRALLNQNVMALGTDQAFALRDEGGAITALKQRVHLSAKDGTLIQPVYNGPFVISAQGYEILNEATGTCVILPGEVLVDGSWHSNPHVIRDPNNRRILAIYARAVAFRFSSKGLPQVSDWTTIFDTPSYRLIDLLAKAKSKPQAFRLLPNEQRPKDDNNATWAKYPFDESTNLWVNTSHDEALAWFSTILNREKKAIDFAQTFAKRNASKHLHGLQKAPGAEWDVEVFCWRPENGQIVKWDTTQYQALKKKVEGLTKGGGEQFALGNGKNGVVIDLKQGQDRVSDEQEDMAMEKSIDPEDQPEMQEETPPPESEPEAPPEQPVEASEEAQQALNQLTEVKAHFAEEFRAAAWNLNLEEDQDFSEDEVRQLINEVSRIVDAGESA